MKKYWIVLKNQFSLIATYRMDLFGRWMMNAFDVIVYTILWSLTYHGDQVQINKLMLYFILYYGIANNIHTGRVGDWISRDINNGDINNYLTKPINFPLVQILKSMTVVFVRIFTPTIILILGNIFSPNIFGPVNLVGFLLFLLFLIIGMIIWNLLLVSIGTIAFRGTEIKALLTTLDLFLNLLKGAYIPAFLFSSSVTKMLSFTFVPYLASFPIRLYQEIVPPQQVMFALMVGLGWILVFLFSSVTFYRKGLKRYEAQGG